MSYYTTWSVRSNDDRRIDMPRMYIAMLRKTLHFLKRLTATAVVLLVQQFVASPGIKAN